MKRLNINVVARARGIAFACGLALAATSPAWAAWASDMHYPAVLRDMVAAGKLTVVKQFPTDKPGMTGYIVKRYGYQTVVYSEDSYLMLGPLFGPKGHNLSQQYAHQYKPKPNVTKALHSLDPDHLIQQGPTGAPRLVVFADPNCIYCHHLYQALQPLVSADRLRVSWAMVDVLGPSSVGRAITILEAQDPAAALARNEANFDVQNEQGGVAVGPNDSDLNKVLKINRQAMFDVGGNGTPTVLFQDPKGHWQARQGMPPTGWLRHYAPRSASTQ